MKKLGFIAVAALLALPAAASDVAVGAEQKIEAVRQKIADRAPALTGERSQRDLRDAQKALKRAESRLKSGNERGALKFAAEAEARLAKAEEVKQ